MWQPQLTFVWGELVCGCVLAFRMKSDESFMKIRILFFSFSIGNKFNGARMVEQFDMRLKSGIWCDFHLIVGRIIKIASGLSNL